MFRNCGETRSQFLPRFSSGLESASYAFFLKMMPGVEKKHRRLVSRVRWLIDGQMSLSLFLWHFDSGKSKLGWGNFAKKNSILLLSQKFYLIESKLLKSTQSLTWSRHWNNRITKSVKLSIQYNQFINIPDRLHPSISTRGWVPLRPASAHGQRDKMRPPDTMPRCGGVGFWFIFWHFKYKLVKILFQF